MSGLNIFVDPIKSEIQVPSSAQVARSVVTQLGMRIVPENPNLVRSDLFMDGWISPDTRDGVMDLVYDAEGTAAQIFDGTGNLVLEGPVGVDLDAGWLRLRLQLPPRRGAPISPGHSQVGGCSGRDPRAPRRCSIAVDQHHPGELRQRRIWEASPASYPHHSRLILGLLANSAPKAEISLLSLSEVRAGSRAVRR